MPPKAKAKKKAKAPEVQEPEHDPSWERAVQCGVWERPVTALPDANTWPTWGALRERVLTSCREISISQSPTVRDAFAAELVKLSPRLLQRLCLCGCSNLRRLVLSPLGACPSLVALDLSGCPSLEYVLLQSRSLQELNLQGAGALIKALIHCPGLQHLSISGCPNLEVCMIWSDELTHLDMTGADRLKTLELHCPNLMSSKVPTLPTAPVATQPLHPPIAAMLKENAREAAQAAAEARAREWRQLQEDATIPAVYRDV